MGKVLRSIPKAIRGLNPFSLDDDRAGVEAVLDDRISLPTLKPESEPPSTSPSGLEKLRSPQKSRLPRVSM